MFIALQLCSVVDIRAQDTPTDVIHVKKVDQLVKAVFDITEMRLIAVDRFGNPKENAVRSFMLYYKIKNKTFQFSSPSNNLTVEMQEKLKALKSAQKVFFTTIKAEDDQGHIVNLPDVIEVVFPDCKKTKKGTHD